MQLIKTKDNNFTINIDNINIHSKYSPIKEAEKFVLERIKHQGTVIVLGPGLGYILKVLSDKYPDLEVISIPYNLELGDYSKRLNPTNRKQWDGSTKIENFLKTHIIEDNIKGLQIVEWAPTAKIYKENSISINNEIIKVVRRLNGNILTTARFGKKWLINSFRNYININEYITNFKINRPIVIVAPGKSLQDSITFLKEIRNSIMLISLSSANRALNYYGLKPDITFSTDPGYYSKLHLSNYNGIISMPLTNSTSENNPILLINQGNKFENDIINLGSLPSIELGENGTVAGTALLFSLNYSKEPIFLVGQDLESMDLESHIRPYAFDNLLEKSTNRTNPFYSVKFKRFINEGISYKTYRDWFTNIGKNYVNRVFRVKSSSSPINGIKEINQEEVKRVLQNQITPPFSYETVKNKSKKQRLYEVYNLLENWLEIVEKEELKENSLFYLISTSLVTDAKDKTLTATEIENITNECRKESSLFIKRLLSIYGRKLF